MDIGKFKSSRLRLTLWLLVPPLLIVGVGLSTYALRLQSEWELNRTRRLSDVLPKLVETQQQARALLEEFQGSETQSVQSEDGLISLIREKARKADFTVDSLKVERRAMDKNATMPVLSATVNGSGSISAIHRFLGDVSASQQLLSESALQISQQANEFNAQLCSANITFDLVLFDNARKGVRK